MPREDLSEEQIEAVALCTDINNRIVGVTGEAGTGKTTILGNAVDDLRIEQGYNVQLCAPTGRAAKRIQEATGISAITIHRMMRWSVPEDDEDAGLPSYTKFNPLPYDVIFIDEASMLSDDLYRSVIDALKSRACIRFFGDANQLPPVQGASPFLAILEKYPSVKLTHNFRSQDGIISAARSINRGLLPRSNDQFTVINAGAGLTLNTIDEFIDQSFGTIKSQLITPSKQGKYGVRSLNKFMQQKLNGQETRAMHLVYKDRDEAENVTVKPNDKIIWMKNDYKLNLFNGMIGWVRDFDLEDGSIVAEFDGKDVLIPPHIESYDPQGRAIFQYDPRKFIDLAYAITTHKAQGSEFDKVVIVLNKSFVLNRANFYTAVTRAKSYVSVIAGHGGLAHAMRREAWVPSDMGKKK